MLLKVILTVFLACFGGEHSGSFSLSVAMWFVVYSTGGLRKAVRPFLLVEHSGVNHTINFPACLKEVAQSCDTMVRPYPLRQTPVHSSVSCLAGPGAGEVEEPAADQ